MVGVLASVGVRILRDMTVLDLGAGQGMHAGFLFGRSRIACSGADVIDYSFLLYNGEFLRLIDEKHRRHGAAFRGGSASGSIGPTRWTCSTATRCSGCVVSINSFEHIPDPAKALGEMIRVAKASWARLTSPPIRIWTALADSGSHFFHRVPEPWAHLAYGDDGFSGKDARERRNGRRGRRISGRDEPVASLPTMLGRSTGRRRAEWSMSCIMIRGRVSSTRRTVSTGTSANWRGEVTPRRSFLIRGLRWVLRKR